MARMVNLSRSNKELSHAFPDQGFLPEAYRLPDGQLREPLLESGPKVVYIEVTNRCNLLCKTCPRTYFEREPLKSLSLIEFIAIAQQFPHMQRTLLHGIGEPLLNRDLPEIIRYLKGRKVEVIINSNGTLLSSQWQTQLVESGLDQYRCSIDGATDETYARIRGASLLPKVRKGLQGLLRTREHLGAATPRISIFCVASKENLPELPDLLRLAAEIGVHEICVQRMVYFAKEPQKQFGMARAELAIFGRDGNREDEILQECTRLSAELGIKFVASGGSNPINSLAAATSADFAPWQACMRPWTCAYVTANGNCLPCCISPFATDEYDSLILGNLFEQPFSEIWNNPVYQTFRTELLSKYPNKVCTSCGIYWSL
ncbi:MAG: radical SAM protein [Anaerolineales bacterium]|jgi:MoaA/NifB/PqqE/SkfB family radical SAM enzyme